MKKILTLMLALVMALTLAACGGSGNDSKDGSGSPGIDMNKYPAAIEDWTGQNFIDYFTEAGACTGGNGFETWIQDHVNYWPGTPVNECAGWWDDEGTTVMIVTLSADNVDTSQEQYDEWINYFRENKSFPSEYMGIPVDHLAGNVAFLFETSILDDAVYEKMSAAYQNLVDTLGVTPDF